MLGLPTEEMAAIQEGLVQIAGPLAAIAMATQDPPPAQPWPTPASNVSPYNPTWWVQWPRVSGFGVHGRRSRGPDLRPIAFQQGGGPTSPRDGCSAGGPLEISCNGVGACGGIGQECFQR
eukprot:357992-Chlamydomonas_euryale.AAC.4